MKNHAVLFIFFKTTRTYYVQAAYLKNKSRYKEKSLDRIMFSEITRT
jgi:hypothetical protein